MADAAAPQPDAEQQPEREALETSASEAAPDLSEPIAAEADAPADVIQAEPIAGGTVLAGGWPEALIQP